MTGPDDEEGSGLLVVGGCVAELQPIGLQISATMAILRPAWGWRAPGSVPMNHGAAMDLVEDPGLSSALQQNWRQRLGVSCCQLK
jgi:hypothetical protein